MQDTIASAKQAREDVSDVFEEQVLRLCVSMRPPPPAHTHTGPIPSNLRQILVLSLLSVPLIVSHLVLVVRCVGTTGGLTPHAAHSCC